MDEPDLTAGTNASPSEPTAAAVPTEPLAIDASNAPSPAAEPTVTPPSQTPKKKNKRARPQNGGVKETLESILVAFILAFIFRAFVVEAFVIPTGSMAPTLLGAHMRYTCSDCGYHFDADYRPPGSNDDTDIPEHAGPIAYQVGEGKVRWDPTIYKVRCPNCGFHLPDDVNPRVYYGDRILVLKYIYLLNAPQRWDVVVFKTPADIDKGKPERADSRTWKYNYAVNYIKRLVGRPGEWLMILDGDIYVAPTEQGPWTIQTKPRSAQSALWRIIYDNDFHPLDKPDTIDTGRRGEAWVQPWQFVDGNTKWDTGGRGDHASLPAARVFTYQGLKGSGTLEFNPNVDRPAVTPAYQDWLAYDQTFPQRQGVNTVRDLKLQFDYTRTAGDGPLILRMSKFDDVFYAEFSQDTVKLTHQSRTGELLQVKTAPLPKATKGSHHIEFTNVDYRVNVRVDEMDLLQTTAEEYHPDIEALKDWDAGNRSLRQPPSVAISARNQECQVEHLSLWRDIYYTPDDGSYVQGSPRKLVHLGPDEYFVCGDNSVASFDSRMWRDPVDLPNEQLKTESGRVPGRFLLGKAFFVYWPAGYRPVDRVPGLIPNFGEMRFIR